MNHSFLQDALVFLAAAIVFVPIVKRLGMGSVFGYLIGGIMIGPFGLGFIGGEGQDIMHFAEFGVVMMLFLIGLELEPVHFWRLRHRISGTGSLQLVLTSLLFLVAFLSLGFSWQAALAVGLALSMSSTAIVHQTLQKRVWTRRNQGEVPFPSCFSRSAMGFLEPFITGLGSRYHTRETLFRERSQGSHEGTVTLLEFLP